jgi:TRAP-type mannitol/chloroaromatic compound transport system permease small subunit
MSAPDRIARDVALLLITMNWRGRALALTRGLEAPVRAAGVVGAWLIVPLTVATCYDVLARYVLGAPTLWAYELGAMLTGANFLLGMALVLARDEHIRVDILYAAFNPRGQRLVRVLTVLGIVLPFSTLLTVALWHSAADAFVTGERTGVSAWNPPLWPFRTVFLVAFALLAIQAVASAVRELSAPPGEDRRP